MWKGQHSMTSRKEARIIELAKQLKIRYEEMEVSYNNFGRSGEEVNTTLGRAKEATERFKETQALFFDAVYELENNPFDVVDC